MVELKYNIDKNTLKTGTEQNFMQRHKKWYVYWLVVGILLIGAGVHFLLLSSRFEVLPYLLMVLGLCLFFKKQFYIRKIVKNALANKPASSEVHGKFSVEEIWIKTIDSEGTMKWTGIYDTIVTATGILFYFQKNIHMWVPREANIIEGTWDELVEISAKASRRNSHLALQ